MGIGDAVRTARETAGLSRDALARMTGLTARTIFRIEHEQNWSRGSVALIASALKLDPEWLLSHIGDGTQTGPNDPEVPEDTKSPRPLTPVRGGS